MKTLLTILVSLVTMLPTHAKYGETLAECIARYGPARNNTKPGTPTVFIKSPFAVSILFERGRAANVNYQRLETDTPNHSKPIAAADILKILKQNAPDTSWREQKKQDGTRIWATTDGKLVALYSEASHVLNIQSAK